MLLSSGCDHDESPWISLTELPPPDATVVAPAQIHDPPELHSIATGRTDATGRPIRASCPTCHGIDALADTWRSSAIDLGAPHAGLRFEHGDNRCDSCHDRDDRLALRLADGRAIPMGAAMQSCRQCHGPPSRDYDHGSHGGMSGYWDTTRGPRTRAHCLDCHDAHHPAWTPVMPAPPPRDRYTPASPEPSPEPEPHDG